MFNPLKPNNKLPLLPGKFDYQKPEFLKKAIATSQSLAKLNGLVLLLPNAKLLISPLLTQESVASSAIENINTTTVKVLQAQALGDKLLSGPEKEVLHYREALLHGFEFVRKHEVVHTNFLIDLQKIIEPSKYGIRKLTWTVIANAQGDVLYTPPEGENIIRDILSNLEKFINAQDAIEPLIKTGVIHYQFESIHPFYDGNGRTGRMLMILYLVLTRKLDYPVLFLSDYIHKNRTKYYQILHKIHETNDYSQIILFILDAIEHQSKITQEKIIAIKTLMDKTESLIQKTENIDYHQCTKILFSQPFISLGDFAKELKVTRQTAAQYIIQLENKKIIKTKKIRKTKLIYIPAFIQLLS